MQSRWFSVFLCGYLNFSFLWSSKFVTTIHLFYIPIFFLFDFNCPYMIFLFKKFHFTLISMRIEEETGVNMCAYSLMFNKNPLLSVFLDANYLQLTSYLQMVDSKLRIMYWIKKIPFHHLKFPDLSLLRNIANQKPDPRDWLEILNLPHQSGLSIMQGMQLLNII